MEDDGVEAMTAQSLGGDVPAMAFKVILIFRYLLSNKQNKGRGH